MESISMGQITGLYVSLFALFYMFLGLRVVRFRRLYRQDIEAGDNPLLARAIRTHANANEYAPITFLLLLICELSGASPLLLHSIGVIFLVARFLHYVGFGLKKGISFGRFWGTVATYSIILTLAVYNIILWIYSYIPKI